MIPYESLELKLAVSPISFGPPRLNVVVGYGYVRLNHAQVAALREILSSPEVEAWRITAAAAERKDAGSS